jgi:hypothetical protein
MDSGEELVLTITSTLTSGNLEIAVVDPDDNVVQFVEVNSTVTVTISSTIAGEYFVIIGGESAEVEIDITRDIN